MRKTLAVLAVLTVLAIAPSASPAGEPTPGCELFGRGVASAQPFYRGIGPGAFGLEVSTLARAAGGDPFEANKQGVCP